MNKLALDTFFEGRWEKNIKFVDFYMLVWLMFNEPVFKATLLYTHSNRPNLIEFVSRM